MFNGQIAHAREKGNWYKNESNIFPKDSTKEIETRWGLDKTPSRRCLQSCSTVCCGFFQCTYRVGPVPKIMYTIYHYSLQMEIMLESGNSLANAYQCTGLSPAIDARQQSSDKAIRHAKAIIAAEAIA
jgi:hypothetical protein